MPSSEQPKRVNRPGSLSRENTARGRHFGWCPDGRVEDKPDAQLQTNSKNTYLIALNRFFGWLVRDRIIDLDATDLQRLKDGLKDAKHTAVRLPKSIDDETLTALLRVAAEEKTTDENTEAAQQRAALTARRNVAMLHVLRSSAMRAGTLVNLTRGNVNLQTGVVRAVTKRDKEQNFYLDSTAIQALRVYLSERGDGRWHVLGALP